MAIVPHIESPMRNRNESDGVIGLESTVERLERRLLIQTILAIVGAGWFLLQFAVVERDMEEALVLARGTTRTAERRRERAEEQTAALRRQIDEAHRLLDDSSGSPAPVGTTPGDASTNGQSE